MGEVTGPQVVLAAWVAQTHDELADLSAERRHALAVRWER
jgi:hypothetical protein